MSSSVAKLLECHVLDVLSERDAGRRRVALESIWSVDGVFVDPEGRSVGFDEIERRIADLQVRFPAFVFVARSVPDAMHDVGRLAWGFGPAGADPAVSGSDIAVTVDDKIVSLYAFIDR
jgi:hypothetical protein